MATRPAELFSDTVNETWFILSVKSPSHRPSLDPRLLKLHLLLHSSRTTQVPYSLPTCLRSIARGGTEEGEYQWTLAVTLNYHMSPLG